MAPDLLVRRLALLADQAFDPSGRAIDPKTLLTGFKGLMVHGSVAQTGTFECSNPLLNDIYRLIHWAMRSNFASVISDCPHLKRAAGWRRTT